jgi:NAD(P)-dependent dehydrogenase (short-subunit alcohol dehydrogenase family)
MGALDGRVAVVTGGVSGIGRACAERFVKEGATVVLADITADKGHGVAEDIARDGGDVHYHYVDVTDESSQQTLFDDVVDQFGQVDAVVAAAGIASASYVTGEVRERSTDPEANFLINKPLGDWQRVLDVNLTGVMLTNQMAVRTMIALDRPGAIVNIASIAGKRPLLGASDYCVSKTGVIMLTQILSAEVSAKGIRVNAIGPGFIETPMTAGIRQMPDWVQNVVGMTPMGRFGRADEVANTALFLVSDEASYFSGQTLFPNGGMFVGL